jgi:hypothetical protein
VILSVSPISATSGEENNAVAKRMPVVPPLVPSLMRKTPCSVPAAVSVVMMMLPLATCWPEAAPCPQSSRPVARGGPLRPVRVRGSGVAGADRDESGVVNQPEIPVRGLRATVEEGIQEGILADVGQPFLNLSLRSSLSPRQCSRVTQLSNSMISTKPAAPLGGIGSQIECSTANFSLHCGT